MANAVIDKANNTTTLSSTGSWTGGVVPVSTDVARWNFNAANTVGVGTSVNFGAIQITSTQTQRVTITAGTGALTLTGLATTVGGLATGTGISHAGEQLRFDTNVTLAGSQTWDVNGSGVYFGVGAAVLITGSTQTVTKKGTKTLASYRSQTSLSSPFNIEEGFLSVPPSSSWGTGKITLNSAGTGTGVGLGCEIDNGTATYANAVDINGNCSFNFAGSASGTVVNVSGAISILSAATVTVNAGGSTWSGTFSGSGALTKGGSSGLALTMQTSTYSGAFSSGSAGNTILGNRNSGVATQLASASSITVPTGSRLFYFGATAYTNNDRTHSGGGNIYECNPGGISFTGNLSGFTGKFYTYLESTLGTSTTATFTTAASFPANANTIGFDSFNTGGAITQTIAYTGSSSVTSSASIPIYLEANGSTAILNHAGTSGAALTLTGAVSNLGSYTTTLRLTVGSSAGALTLGGNITDGASSTTSLSKTGTGVATLSGTASTYKGSVTVSAGTLNANSATALGADTSSGTVSSGATLSLGAALNYSTRNWTINGTGVTVGGVLQGAVTHAYAGTAKIGAITLGAAAYVRGTQEGTLSSSILLATGGKDLDVGAVSGTKLSLSGGVSGAGSITVGRYSSDTGIVSLPTANSYSVLTTLNSYGTLQVGNASALGTSTIVFGGGGGNNCALDASTPLTLANALTVSSDIRFTGTASLTLSAAMSLGASRTITVNGSTLTLLGVVSGAGFGITKQGSGTLTLANGGNTFTGNILVSAGSLTASGGYTNSSSNSIGANTVGKTFVVSSGAVLNTTSVDDISFNSPTTNNILFTISGTWNNNPANNPSAGFQRVDTLTLNGATLNDRGNSLASYGGILAAQTVTVTGSTASTYNQLGNGVGLGILNTTFNVADVTGSSAVDLTIDGVVRDTPVGTGNFTKSGSGTMQLLRTNTFTGSLTVSAGLLDAAAATVSGNPSAIGNGANTVTISSGATLLFSASRSAGYHSGSVTVNGGKITITGTDTNLAVGNSITLDTAASTIDGSGSGMLRRRGAGNSLVVTSAASGSTVSVPEYNLIDNDTTFNVANGAQDVDLQVSSIISQFSTARGLTKSGTGTLELTNTNTYSGTTTIAAGRVLASNTQALGTGTVSLTADTVTLQTKTAGGQNGKLTVASLNNTAGGTIKIGG